MSEEKKAIEDIRNELIDEDKREYMNKWFADDLEIVLNLIQKQQNKIDKAAKYIKENKTKIDDYGYYTFTKDIENILRGEDNE